MPCDEFDRPRGKQPARDDQNKRDDDSGGMPEAREGFLGWNHTGDKRNHQGTESDEIVTEFTPDQQSEDATQKHKQNYLVIGHAAQTSRLSRLGQALACINFPASGQGLPSACGKVWLSPQSHPLAAVLPVEKLNALVGKGMVDLPEVPTVGFAAA